MEKRYQVFISSTYEDLKEERANIIQILWELNCIPYGMEVFPATNNSSWDWIERAIKESDYFILIIGGKYGSIHHSGISYTQKEYEYAKSVGIPSISFIVKEDTLLASKIEKKTVIRRKLEEFKGVVRNDKNCRFYTSPDDLSKQVSISLQQLIKDNPRVGWIRADDINPSLEKFNNSHKKISVKKDGLPDGENEITLIFSCKYRIEGKSYDKYDYPIYYADHYKGMLKISWNEIFYNVGSYLMDTHYFKISSFDSDFPLFEKTLRKRISDQIEQKEGVIVESIVDVNIASRLKEIFLHFVSLKCISKSGEYWRITNTGMRYLASLKEKYENK